MLGWRYKEDDDCESCPSNGTKQFDELCHEAMHIISPNDIDECLLRSDLCPNGVCVNTNSGYKCVCKQGYEQNSEGLCVDKDECREGLCRDGTCINR